jgi:hypothetical protein
MKLTLTVFAVFVLLSSVLALVFPTELLTTVREIISGPGVWFAVIMRLGLAVLLWLSAPISRTPVIFKILSLLAVAGAVLVLVLGSEGLVHLIDWYAEQPSWVLRLAELLI